MTVTDMDDGTFSAQDLKRSVRQAVEAGEIDPDDKFVEFSETAAKVMGGNEHYQVHQCRSGTWAFVGAAITAALCSGNLPMTLSIGQSLGVVFLIGWALNERERRQCR